MLEKILIEVCQSMGRFLNDDQIHKLKNVLYIAFRDKTITESKEEIVLAEPSEDTKLIQAFVASKAVAGRGKRTLQQYVREIKICQTTIGKPLKDITAMDLRWYLGLMQERRKNKPVTLQNKIRYLNSFYTFLEKEGILSTNPVSRIEAPKIPKSIKKPFNSEEMEALRKACVHTRDRALVEFLYSTGLRVSEISSLDVSDIDMTQKELTVIGKGSKERTVYFSAAASFWLKEYLDWRMSVERLSFEELSSKPLFACVKKPYNRILKPGIESLCHSLGKLARVENVHPHRFRRTFATNMMNRGMKMEELMKLMGHAKIDTTLIYCSISQENIRSSYTKRCA